MATLPTTKADELLTPADATGLIVRFGSRYGRVEMEPGRTIIADDDGHIVIGPSADEIESAQGYATTATEAATTATTAAGAAAVSADLAQAFPLVGVDDLQDLIDDTGLTAEIAPEGAVVVSRSGGSWIVADDAEPAPHRTNAAGRGFMINMNRNRILASTVVRATDSDDTGIALENSTLAQRVIDYLAANGGGLLEFDAGVRVPLLYPIACRSKVHLLGNGALLENIRTAYVSGEVGADAVIFMGSGALQDDDDHTWTAIKAAPVGQGYIEPVSGSTAWTAVGREIAFCAATAADFGAGLKHYDQHHIRVVRAITGGKIYLDRPITEALVADGSGTIGSSVVVGSAWAADVSFANAAAKGAGLTACAPRHAISRASFCDFVIRARNGNPFARQMMHDCTVDTVQVIPSDTAPGMYGLGGNFFSHSIVNNWRAQSWVRQLEIAGMSKFSRFTNLYLDTYAPPGVTLPAQETRLRIAGEASVGITVEGLIANCGTLTSAQDVVKFSGGTDCALLNSQVWCGNGGGGMSFDGDETGHRISGLAMRGSYATPVNLKGTGIIVEGCNINAIASSGKTIKVLTGASGCIVRQNHLNGGTIRFDGVAGALLNSVYGNDGVTSIEYAAAGDARGNSSAGLAAARSVVGAQVTSNGVTNTTATLAAMMTDVVIPAGGLTTGDALLIDISGTKTATAGNTSSGEVVLTATVNGTTYTLASFTFGEGKTSCDWRISGSLRLMGTTSWQTLLQLTTENAKAVVPSGSTLTLSGGSLSLASDGAKAVQTGSTLVLGADLPVTVTGGGVQLVEARQTGVSDMSANTITLALQGRVTATGYSDSLLRRVADISVQPRVGYR